MNPFSLPGPEFLAFYLFLGVGVIAAAIIVLRRRENALPAVPRLSDPYQIAFLRGGEEETIRVAAASLLDRQLLTLDTPKKGPGVLVTASGATMDAARPVIERSILKRFQSPGTIDELTRDAQLIAATQDYKNKLMRMGLLPDEDLTKRRQDLATAAIAILLGTAFIKILVALSRGRWNIGFLVLLAVIFAIVAFAVTHPRLTRAGKNVLGDLKELFAGLRGRAYSFAPGKNSDEFLFLVAVFGLAAVSSTYPFAAALRASPAAALSSSTCGASMGSGCGSSSGSSCGSGCGGGGCGGGCGGCGS